MCLPCLFRLIALRTTKHTRVGLRERSTNVASAEFINFRWMQAVFFFSISFFFFFATTRSHNKPYPDEWHVPALGRPNKVVPALHQKRRSWFTELPNTSSCYWLERKVNRQGIFFRTPYPLVQSHFHIKPLCVTGVPNLLNYIIIRWRCTLRDVMLWYSDTWLHVVQKCERKSGVMKHKYSSSSKTTESKAIAMCWRGTLGLITVFVCLPTTSKCTVKSRFLSDVRFICYISLIVIIILKWFCCFLLNRML